MKSLPEIQAEIIPWREKNFPICNAQDMLIGATEELGELCHANLKRRMLGKDLSEEEKDALGDIMVFLLDYCNMQGFDLFTLINITWETVKQRNYNDQREKKAQEPVKNGTAFRHTNYEGEESIFTVVVACDGNARNPSSEACLVNEHFNSYTGHMHQVANCHDIQPDELAEMMNDRPEWFERVKEQE